MKKSTQQILLAAGAVGVGVLAYKAWKAKKAVSTLTTQAAIAAQPSGQVARMAAPSDADYEEFEVVDDWYGPGIVGGWGRGGWGGGRRGGGHGGGHHGGGHHGGGHHH